MTTSQTADQALFEKAKAHIPGGVNSPVRAFTGVGGTPVFISRAKGAYIYDTENRPYIDYVGSWGPMILGHAYPPIVEAVKTAADDGLSFGTPTLFETTMADLICGILPHIEMIRMVSSGTEATMSAIRLARGYTGCDKIVKFEGCYHGHSDSLLVKAGSGMLDIGEPTSKGVPADFAKHTLTLPYNDIDALTVCFDKFGKELACVIIEPIAGNMNMIIPSQAFHEHLRRLCSEYGVVLIFDEVMTGFRVGLKGASEHFGLTPDLTTFGKIIGAGLPVGAFGGRREIMSHIAPLGGVYQAGTLSGNPLAMRAGLAMFDALVRPNFYSDLTAKTEYLLKGLTDKANKHGVPFATCFVGGMFGFYLSDTLPKNFNEVARLDSKVFAKFFHAMLSEGIYLAPSAFEASFMSSAHSFDDLDKTIDCADRVFGQL